VCCYIRPATSNFTAKKTPKWNRVLKGAFERLELLEAKVSRAVLRGGDGGNTVFLPDGEKRTVRDTTRRQLLAGQRKKRHLAGILPYIVQHTPLLLGERQLRKM